MACTKPLKGWFSDQGGFTMKSSRAYLELPMQVPCGQCMGCRLAKTADWATRITHESQLYEENAFVTLTYSDDKLPDKNSLCKKDVQKFYKRLRASLRPSRIRHFTAGEYGDRTQRPHYHAIIFNYWPSDSKTYKKTDAGTLFTSEGLEKIWGKGFVVIGICNYETASYTASYVTKKITGPDSKMYYGPKEPPFALMSRRPGIGNNWYNIYGDDTFKHNFVVVNGHKRVPPRYYRNKLKESDPKLYQQLLKDTFKRKLTHEESLSLDKFYLSRKSFYEKNIN